MEPLTSADIEAIADRLAWTDGTLDDATMGEFGVDSEDLNKVMESREYEWDCSTEAWESRRAIWRGWDGLLPSANEER